MSADTPRTNGAVFVVFPSPSNDVEAVDADFARQLERENADLIKRLETHDGWDDYNAIKALQAEKAALRKDKDRLDWLNCRTVSRLDWVLTNVEMHKLPIRDAIDVSMKEVEP